MKTIWLFILTLTLAACVSLPTTTPQPIVADMTPITAIATPTNTPTLTATRRPSATRTPRPTRTPVAPPTRAPILDIPPGLIFQDKQGSWLITANGQPQPISKQRRIAVSPNDEYGVVQQGDSYNIIRLADQQVLGNVQSEWLPDTWAHDSQKLFYEKRDVKDAYDIWVFDLLTGTHTNLTNTPEREETFYSDWVTQSGQVIFYSWPMNTDIGLGFIGFLTTIQPDGSNYTVVEAHELSSPASLSTNQTRLAYSIADISNGYRSVPYIYQPELGSQLFHLARYGLDPSSVSVFSPSWSPDNQHLAWQMDTPDDRLSIGIFDYIGQSVWIVKNLREPFYEGYPPALRWSPDGRWGYGLLINEATKQFGLWFLEPRTQTVTLVIDLGAENMYASCSSAWSPDRHWLALACDNQAVQLVNLDTLAVQTTSLKDIERLIDWAEIHP